MARGVMAGALAALLLATSALAPARAEEKPGRFSMSPTEGGFLRLDTQTGAVSFCSRRNADWQCSPVGDESAAIRQENETLKARNAELEAEVRRLDELVGLREKDGQDKRAERPVRPGLQLPSEQDVDKALDYLSRMFRKFRDKLKELEEPEPKGNKI